MKFLVINLIVYTTFCRDYTTDSSDDSTGSVFGPVFAFFLGIALILSAFPCLWFNERRYDYI
jgi:hypothetical protein